MLEAECAAGEGWCALGGRAGVWRLMAFMVNLTQAGIIQNLSEGPSSVGWSVGIPLGDYLDY